MCFSIYIKELIDCCFLGVSHKPVPHSTNWDPSRKCVSYLQQNTAPQRIMRKTPSSVSFSPEVRVRHVPRHPEKLKTRLFYSPVELSIFRNAEKIRTQKIISPRRAKCYLGTTKSQGNRTMPLLLNGSMARGMLHIEVAANGRFDTPPVPPRRLRDTANELSTLLDELEIPF